MLPVVTNDLYCELPFLKIFTMPRVVPDQREKFENDELFRKLSREAEVRYTGYRDRPHEERKTIFQNECREGHADVAYSSSGLNLPLSFLSNAWSDRPEDRIPTKEFVDFEKEPGKVHLKSQFIMNGVCVVWKGWVDLLRLDGAGYMEFDAERARVEDSRLREQIEQYNRQLQEFEDRQRQYREERERQAEAEAEVVQTLLDLDPGNLGQSTSGVGRGLGTSSTSRDSGNAGPSTGGAVRPPRYTRRSATQSTPSHSQGRDPTDSGGGGAMGGHG